MADQTHEVSIKITAKTEAVKAFQETKAEAQALGKEMDRLSSGMSSAGRASVDSSKQIAGIAASGREATSALGGNGLGGAFDKLSGAIKNPLGSMKEFGSSLVSSMGGMGGWVTVAAGLAATAAVVAAELGKLMLAAIDLLASFDDMADTTGMSVEFLSELKYAADVVGIPIEKLTDGIFKMQATMQQSPDKFAEGLQHIGLTLEEIQRLEPEEQFLKIAAAFRENASDSNRAETALALFGKTGKDLIPALTQDLAGLTKEAKDLNFTLSTDSAAAAERFEMSMNKMYATMGKWKTEIGLGIFDFFRDLGTWYDVLDDKLGSYAKTMSYANSLIAVGRASSAMTGGPAKTDDMFSQAQRNLKKPEYDSSYKPQIADAAYGLKYGQEQLDRQLNKQQEQRRDAAREFKEQEQLKRREMQKTFDAGEQIFASIARGAHKGLIRTPFDDLMDAQAEDAAMLNRGKNLTAMWMEKEMTPGLIKVPAQKIGKLFSAELSTTILASLTGGGNTMDAVGGLVGSKIGEKMVKNFGGTITSALGPALGGAFNAILPGIGSLLGPLLGKVGGFFKNIFGGPSKEELANREGIASFQEGLNSRLTPQQSKEAGPDQWKKTTIVVRDAFLAAGRSAEEVDRILKDLWNDKDPKKYKAAIEDITAVMDEQQRMLDDEKQDRADLQTAIEHYGFTIEELGPTMRKQQLTEQAMGLANDFRLLTASGIDMNTVLGRMGDEINDFVNTAIRTGTEVPAEMKPLIDKMIELGQLTDANGNKVESLEGSGITFAETMTQGFDRVVKKLDEVFQNLGLIARVEIPDKDFDITGHQRLIDEGGAEGANPDVPSFATEAYVRHPTLAMIGDTPGGEFVLKPSTIQQLMQASAQSGSSTGKGSPIFNFNISTVVANSDPMRQLMQKEIMPLFLEALSGNKGGSLTEMKTLLGVV